MRQGNRKKNEVKESVSNERGGGRVKGAKGNLQPKRRKEREGQRAALTDTIPS